MIVSIGLSETTSAAPRAALEVTATPAPGGPLGGMTYPGARHAAFYATYRPRLVCYLVGRFGPRDAEDIAEEALVRALSVVDLDRSVPEVWSWLKLVAGRIAISLHRERLRCDVASEEGAQEGPEIAATAPDAESAALARLDAECLRRALRTLSPAQRRALWLREVEGWAIPILAEALGVSAGAARQLLVRARRHLAQEYLALTGSERG